jgi:hypothetical protein
MRAPMQIERRVTAALAAAVLSTTGAIYGVFLIDATATDAGLISAGMYYDGDIP